MVQRSIPTLECAPNHTREWPDFRHQVMGLKLRASKPKASLFTRVVRTNPLTRRAFLRACSALY